MLPRNHPDRIQITFDDRRWSRPVKWCKSASSCCCCLARIHRRRASGQCPEAARGCSCESGIMVFETKNRSQNRSTQ